MDMDGGHEHIGTQMCCMCMQMDCLWAQMSVKKEEKNLLVGWGG